MTRYTGSINRLRGIAAPLAAFAALHPPDSSARRRSGEAVLLVAVDKFFLHLWRQQFSEGPREVVRKTSVEALQNRLQLSVRRRFGPTATVRESFQQTPECVQFRLLALRPNLAPVELAVVERPRR